MHVPGLVPARWTRGQRTSSSTLRVMVRGAVNAHGEAVGLSPNGRRPHAARAVGGFDRVRAARPLVRRGNCDLTHGGIAEHDSVCSREDTRDAPRTSGPLLLGLPLRLAVSLQRRASRWVACVGRGRQDVTLHRGCSDERCTEVAPPLGSLGAWTAPRAHRSRSGRRGERAGVRRQLVRRLGLPHRRQGELDGPGRMLPLCHTRRVQHPLLLEGPDAAPGSRVVLPEGLRRPCLLGRGTSGDAELSRAVRASRPRRVDGPRARPRPLALCCWALSCEWPFHCGFARHGGWRAWVGIART
jgi:hypothetical protein